MGGFGYAGELKYRLVGAIGKAFMYAICALGDGELENHEFAARIRGGGRRVIYAFWHGRMLVPVWTHRDSNIGILISRSRDGEYVARVAGALGFHVVRGSSTRGAEEGFRLLLDAINEGYDVAITPDGPTGPKYQVKRGIVHLARVSGAAILPVGIAIDRYKQLASWDEFRVMLPGSYVLARYGEPIIVPEHANKPHMEETRRELEATLNELTRDVESRVAEARRTRHERIRHRGED
jgi:hypothetical protein